MDARRIHIGGADLPGWSNLDAAALQRLAVVPRLAHRGVDEIFIDGFLETLRIDRALRLLKESHRALAPGGTLRVRTLDLDRVFPGIYASGIADAGRARLACFEINASFHGGGRNFLYNRAMLERALRHAGFATVESRDDDTGSAGRALVVEARGIGPAETILPDLLRDLVPEVPESRPVRLVKAITRRIRG
jgi:hypothetical protein